MSEKKPLAHRVVERFAFEMFAMSNLRPARTGVEGAIIWVSSGEFGGADSQHGPRIKVVPGNKITREALQDSVSVRITNPPIVLGELPGKIKKQVIQFVDVNRDTLISYWKEEITTDEMMDAIVLV